MITKDRIIEIINKCANDSKDEIINFAGELIRTRSENPPGDESVIADLISRQAKKWNLNAPEIWYKKDSRPNLIFTTGNKIAENSKTLVLNAHMDTKPAGDLSAWDHAPFDGVIINNRLYGRGSTDMKGAIAAILAAAMILENKKIELKGKLMLAFTADEEAGSAYGAGVLVERKLKADAILIAEPSGINSDFDSLGIACRGALLGKVLVFGTQMHSSISDKGGCINASIKMAEVLLEFAKNLKRKLKYNAHFLYPGGPTINPGVMLNGGIFYGVIPGEASFGFDIRTIPGMKNNELVENIKDFLNELMKKDPDLKAELVIEKPPLDNLLPAEIDKNDEIVKSCLSASKAVLGFEPNLIGVPFSTDAIYLANQLKIPTIPSFGPGLIRNAHVSNEYIEVKSILDAAKIFSITAISYLNHKIVLES